MPEGVYAFIPYTLKKNRHHVHLPKVFVVFPHVLERIIHHIPTDLRIIQKLISIVVQTGIVPRVQFFELFSIPQAFQHIQSCLSAC